MYKIMYIGKNQLRCINYEIYTYIVKDMTAGT